LVDELCRDVEDLKFALNMVREDVRSLRSDLAGLVERVESLAVSLEWVEMSLRAEVSKVKEYASLLIQIESRRGEVG
jgi:hypothetical protein